MFVKALAALLSLLTQRFVRIHIYKFVKLRSIIDNMNLLVILKSYNTQTEALLDKSYLEANGIPCSIDADNLGGAYPFPFQPNPNGIELKVEKKNLDTAKKLLEKVK